MAESAATRAQLGLDLSIPDPLPTLAPEVEQCIYRVAQEAVANVTHHAGAHTLELHLTCADREVGLRVRDDGRGFDSTAGHEQAERKRMMVASNNLGLVSTTVFP